MYTKNKFIYLLGILLLLSDSTVYAFDWVSRSRDQFGKDDSHFFYPIVVDVPGIGSSSGLGSTLLNINNTDTDFTGFVLRGEFDVTGGTFLNYHLLENTLLFDVGVYDFEAGVIKYQRGIDSSKDDYIIPRLSGQFMESQLTWTSNQRHIESYLHFAAGRQAEEKYYSSKDNAAYPVEDDSKKLQRIASLGFRFDNTNDRLNPSKGYRFEAAVKFPYVSDPIYSKYYITDYNVTGYIPLRTRDSLAFNFFRSDAHVYNYGETDRAALDVALSLNCASYPTLQEQQSCQETQDSRVNQTLAANTYGTATPLGGTQRLRSFANGRYYASHAVFYGVEYRLNINDEKLPFDFYFAKGIRTGLQFAFFAGQGSVSDHTDKLLDKLKTSYGVGFRVILSGVILRADYATGSEGAEFQAFIDYPWGINSIDG